MLLLQNIQCLPDYVQLLDTFTFKIHLRQPWTLLCLLALMQRAHVFMMDSLSQQIAQLISSASTYLPQLRLFKLLQVRIIFLRLLLTAKRSWSKMIRFPHNKLSGLQVTGHQEQEETLAEELIDG